jgi:hypothetical protein
MHTEYNIHSITNEMNTVQGFGTILYVLFIHENKLPNVSSTLLYSTDISDLYLIFSIMSICYNTTTKKLSKD